jgi:hypothetical protein
MVYVTDPTPATPLEGRGAAAHRWKHISETEYGPSFFS